MPLLAYAGTIPANLAELLRRNAEVGQRGRQHDQVTPAQQLGVQGKIANPVDDLAIQRHQFIADFQQIFAPAQHAAGFADEVDGVIG